MVSEGGVPAPLACRPHPTAREGGRATFSSFTRLNAPRRFGAGRWRVPGLGTAPHLPGAVAGDQGFDPLGLATDPAAFDK